MVPRGHDVLGVRQKVRSFLSWWLQVKSSSYSSPYRSHELKSGVYSTLIRIIAHSVEKKKHIWQRRYRPLSSVTWRSSTNQQHVEVVA